MMAVLLLAAALFGVGLLVFWMEPLFVLSVIERLTPNVIYRVRTHRPVVALSFDDGPHPTFTLQVLEILQRHDAKATFFLIGERAIRHPAVVFHIKAAGHKGAHWKKSRPRSNHHPSRPNLRPNPDHSRSPAHSYLGAREGTTLRLDRCSSEGSR